MFITDYYFRWVRALALVIQHLKLMALSLKETLKTLLLI